MLLGRTEATGFFFKAPESLVWQWGDRRGCLSCFAFSVISHSCSPLLCKMGHTEMKRIGLITSQGSLGAYLTCLSRDKRFYSKSSSFQTCGSYLLALGFLSFHPVMLRLCVYVCT